MRILITNDDGIDAPGIQSLAMSVRHLGEVFVVAPNQQRSAASHSISIHHPLVASDVDWTMDGIARCIALSGTPVDCVNWSLNVLASGFKFDLVLSGINDGANLATDVLYSGTVAAAGEASLQGVPAVAFSLVGRGGERNFDVAGAAAARIAAQVTRITLPTDTFLNVNFPSKDPDGPWKITTLGGQFYRHIFQESTDVSGQLSYAYQSMRVDVRDDSGSDVLAVRDGRISITPLRYRFTNPDAIDSLEVALASDKERVGEKSHG